MLRKETIDEIDVETEKENLKRIEAILFVSGKFLNMKDLVSLSDLNPIVIREVIEKLEEEYKKRDTSLQITEKNEMWKMDVKAEYSKIANRLASGSSEFSKAEQETLAIIAFKQPVKQSVIVKIRGNKSYDHIKRFMELGLIRKKKMGHTYELSLSDDFYNYFNVSEDEIVKKNRKMKRRRKQKMIKFSGIASKLICLNSPTFLV